MAIAETAVVAPISSNSKIPLLLSVGSGGGFVCSSPVGILGFPTPSVLKASHAGQCPGA